MACCVSSCSSGATSPDEGELLAVHAVVQRQAGVLPERRHDETEDQRDAHKHGRQDDLDHGEEEKS